MAQVQVFLSKQDTAVDTPPHRTSKTVAAALSNSYPRLVHYDRSSLTLRLLTQEAWSSIKARLRPKTVKGVVRLEQLEPLGYHVMAEQAYPPTPRDAKEREKQRALWLGAERF